MSEVDRVALAIWQTYVAEVGRSLPEGLADKLAQAAVEEMDPPEHRSKSYRDVAARIAHPITEADWDLYLEAHS